MEGLIKNTSLKKLRLHLREYERADDGGIIFKNGPTFYLIFKITNPATIIGVSNLKDETENQL